MNQTEIKNLMNDLYEATSQQNKAPKRIKKTITDLIESTCSNIGLRDPGSLEAYFVQDGLILGHPGFPVVTISRDGTVMRVWNHETERAFFYKS